MAYGITAINGKKINYFHEGEDKVATVPFAIHHHEFIGLLFVCTAVATGNSVLTKPFFS